MEVQFKPLASPLCADAIRRRFPAIVPAQLVALGLIWDEVVHRIIMEMLTLSLPDAQPLHINMREEMATELGSLLLWLGEPVVDQRSRGRELSDIDYGLEQKECLGAEGASVITSTAQMAYEHIWKRKLNERWKPKSAKAIEREKSPRHTKLPIKAVGKNHFIPRWFIRDYWAADGKILRWRKNEGGWKSKRKAFGEWGYRSHLYSDWLEAYFSLLEGDAKRPVEMLLDSQPLNIPQRDALVGFLVIQIIRSPFFIEAVQAAVEPVIVREGHADNQNMQRLAYEALFNNNEFYDSIAHPIMWSQWALVRSDLPLFILPDTFNVRGSTGGGTRIIVPLTPNTCFVTLPQIESAKRIVPHHLVADEVLAQRISAALANCARNEFLSHPDFTLNEISPPTLEELLGEISQAIADRDQNL